MEIIVFTQRVELVSAYQEKRDCADQRIAGFIKASGYLPVPLPNDACIVSEIIYELKPAGIILTGGNSLARYGGNAPERDKTDRKLIELAIYKNIPLYGFCRGMQSVLDFFGNDLVNVQGHIALRHKITSREGTAVVNSYHNQGCMSLKNNELEVVMKAEDGVIEKVQHRELPVAGTMWHPEREHPFCEMDQSLIKKLMGEK